MNQIQKQKEAYYKQQGIAPGVPTMKGAYGDPENTQIIFYINLCANCAKSKYILHFLT